jgi:hypothetical protein
VAEPKQAPITYSDITRANARQLAEQVGSFARFAERVGMAEAQVSQILGRNPIRNIGSKLGRKIEAAFDKPVGWLDRPQDGTEFGDHSGGTGVMALSVELEAFRDRAAKAAACLRAASNAPELDSKNLVALALSLLDDD